MSAAEADPAGHGRMTNAARAVNADRRAPVIPIGHARTGRAGVLGAARGWRTHMDSTDGPAVPAERSAAELFADEVEKTMNAIGKSITQSDTADVYQATLDIWERALEGAAAKGIIDERQLGKLIALLEGMKQAPRLV